MRRPASGTAEDCGEHWASLELRERYSLLNIAVRLYDLAKRRLDTSYDAMERSSSRSGGDVVQNAVRRLRSTRCPSVSEGFLGDLSRI
jgi:hypothetical protein